MDPNRKPEGRRAHGLLTWTLTVSGLGIAYPELAGAQQTESSTGSITFPEDGGALPRSQMPEGGVTPDWRKSGGTPEDQGATDQHPGAEKPHHHHGEVIHQHPAGEEKHHHHGDDDPHAHPGDDDPDHEHPARTGPDPRTSPGRTALGHSKRVAPEDDGFWLGFDGYLRVIGQFIENDDLPFVGRNDGFSLGSARLGFISRYGESLMAYIQLEAAVAKAEDTNDPNVDLSVGIRDAYLIYSFSERASLWVGRFKVPYDLGALERTRTRVFIDAPLETRGIERIQGLETKGLDQGRQIGVMLQKDRLKLSEDGFDLGYALALTNGRTDTLALNDNDKPAGFARLSAHYGEWVSLHVAGFLDSRTVGDLPNLFEEEVRGAEASLEIMYADLRVEAQVLFQSTEFITALRPEDVTAIGFHVQWSYQLWGFEAGYRFAFYDPNTDFDLDNLRDHTLSLTYIPEALPLRISINGTLADEERDINNNRITLLSQYSF